MREEGINGRTSRAESAKHIAPCWVRSWLGQEPTGGCLEWYRAPYDARSRSPAGKPAGAPPDGNPRPLPRRGMVCSAPMLYFPLGTERKSVVSVESIGHS